MPDVRLALRRVPPRIRACLALGGGWLLFFAPVAFSAGVPFERDVVTTVNPLRSYLRERLSSGQLPQWYPYELLGVPFAGSVVVSPFHPQTLLIALFSTPVATKWSILLAYVLALAGAYRLARQVGASRTGSVTGAYAFTFGGYLISLNNNPPFLIPMATSTWVIGAALRLARRDDSRDVAALGLFWSLVFLGGDAQLFLECGLIGFLALLASRPTPKAVGRFFVATILAGLVPGVELVPALALSGDSIRAYWTQTKTLALMWAFHPLRLADFLLPNFIPRDAQQQAGLLLGDREYLFTQTVFIGGLCAVFFLLGIFRRSVVSLAWGGIALVGLWLATGYYGGLINYWWRVALPFTKFRYPEKYLALVALASIPLVALGLDAARRSPGRAALVALPGGLLLLSLWQAASPAQLADWAVRAAGSEKHLDPGLARLLEQAWAAGLLQTGAVLVLLGGVLLLTRRWSQVAAALPVLVLAELWSANSGRMPLASASAVESVGEMASAAAHSVGAGEPAPRIIPCAAGAISPMPVTPDDTVRVTHLCIQSDDAGRGGVSSFESNSSAVEWRVLRTFFGSKNLPNWPTWLPRFNVCYRIANDVAPPSRDEQILASVESPRFWLVKHPCLGRAYLARAEPVADAAAAQDRLRAGLPDDLVVWEGGPAVTSAGGSVRWIKADPEHLKIEVDASVPSAFVETDAYATGWTATLDGNPVPIFPTQAAARGLFMPAGSHVVEMQYRAPGFVWGALLSLLGLAGCVGVVVTSSKQTFGRHRLRKQAQKG